LKIKSLFPRQKGELGFLNIIPLVNAVATSDTLMTGNLDPFADFLVAHDDGSK